MQEAKLPEPIATAVNALLSPYGLSVNALTNPQQDDKVKYYSPRAAGIYTSISRWTIFRAIKAGQLPAIKMNQAKTGKVLIARTDLDKWILSHRMKVA
ncbi:MAG: hypothetical protein HQ521_19550 [Bacteroidetes bacterium]|nr:hypothetical protein [Bacteroidota bacterium]